MDQPEFNVRYPQKSDNQLIALSKQGDQDAFGDLYIKYIDKIYRYIYYRIHQHTEAEDLTEDVFLKAWKNIDNFEDKGVPFLAWLYRIARNVVIDHTRGSKASFVDIDTQYSLVDGIDGPELQVLRSNSLEQVLSAMTCLDSVQQDVLTLRFLQGLSHKETAEVLDRKVGAVRVMQHRALDALRTVLRADDA